MKQKDKHFPTVAREINEIRHNREARDYVPQLIEKICEAIEDAYGRLTASVYDSEEYDKNRMRCNLEAINDKHFSEKTGTSFCHLVDRKEIDEWVAKSEYIFQNKIEETFFKLFQLISLSSCRTDKNKPQGIAKSSELSENSSRTRDRRRSLDSISDISSSSFTDNRSPGNNQRKGRTIESEDDDVILIRSRSGSTERERL